SGPGRHTGPARGTPDRAVRRGGPAAAGRPPRPLRLCHRRRAHPVGLRAGAERGGRTGRPAVRAARAGRAAGGPAVVTGRLTHRHHATSISGDHMTHQDVELLAIGAGPSNLALAVALEELAPDDLARNSLLIDRADAVVWQQGLLLPWVTSQISFLKDLVTLRNPCSEFSFVNFLHATGRLDDFVNLGNLWPYRSEISEYLSWVASGLCMVRVQLGR